VADRHASAAPRWNTSRATASATPDATAHASASGQPVEGLAGFSGGSSPRAVFHAAFNPARTARPAAAPAAPPTTFHAIWFTMEGDCPNAPLPNPAAPPVPEAAGGLGGQGVAMPEPDGILATLLARCRRDHLAWINGDAAGYALPIDGTILGGVGGYSFGGPDTAAPQALVAAQWRSGSGDVEFLNGAATDDLAWLSFVERAVVVFHDDPAERRWDLRVTRVFRRNGDDWERIHRHADPLVDRRSPADVSSLLD
jgi:hypothetical protein